jgi:predicted RNase H-like nuclease
MRRIVPLYPHVALLRLLSSTKRTCYKVSKSRKYWRGQLFAPRRKLLLEQFDRILNALSHDIRDIPLQRSDFEQIPTLSGLKCFEDKLDALVCGWMGMQYLRGKATAYGDESAAIWVPSAI